jgi:hypothetical protein
MRHPTHLASPRPRRYAFNSLQAKFMPDALKPPTEVLAALFDKEKIAT